MNKTNSQIKILKVKNDIFNGTKRVIDKSYKTTSKKCRFILRIITMSKDLSM